MKLSHKEFSTNDGLNLPGLLYEPEETTDKVAIFLHGNGSSSVFYSPNRGELYAEYLNTKGIAYFSFNNRGAHIVKKLDRKIGEATERIKCGTAYEIIKECILDINGAVEFLKTKGYKTFYLIGISTGANKICVYNYYQPDNSISKYVLLNGGDDSGIVYNEWGEEKFFKVLNICKEKIEQGKGEELAPIEWLDIYSYKGIYDILNPDGDYNTFPYHEALNNLKISTKELFREFKSIVKPALIVHGENDDYSYGRVPEIIELLKVHSNPLSQNTFKIMPGADHRFSGHEEEMIEMVAEWLEK